MKNKLIRIISATMAFSVILGAYGCKKTEPAKNTGTADDPSNPSAISEVVPVSGDLNKETTVFEYTSVDSNKKEVQATKVVEYDKRALYNVVRSGENLKNQLKENKDLKEKMKQHIDNYNIDEKQYEEIVKKAENWVSFDYACFITNATPTRITTDRLSHTNTDGIVLDDYTSVGCEIGLDPGGYAEILLHGLYDESKYSDEAAVMDALSKMNIQVVYLPIENMDQTIDDFENPQFKTFPLTITK